MRTLIKRSARQVGLSLALFAVTACGAKNTAPTAVLATETFSGTLNPLGASSHSFTVNYTSGSDASITVTALVAASSGTAQAITIGVGFGSVNLGACTRAASYTNATAPLNTELQTSGSPFGSGTYCAQIFDNPDSPTVTEPLNYTIVVKHY